MNGPGSLLLAAPVKRTRSSSASASTALQPHRTQHSGAGAVALALSVRSISSTLSNQELPSSVAMAEPPCTPKDASRCTIRRAPPSVWPQFVSVWQSAQYCFHSDNTTTNAPSSPSSVATSLPSPVLSESPTRPLFPLLTFVPQHPSSETSLISTSQLAAYYPILLVIVIFPISTAVILATLSTLPIPSHFPKTIIDVRQMGYTLQAYSESGWTPLLHVLAALCLTGLWKHAWSIPGAAVLVSGAVLLFVLFSSDSSWHRTSSLEFCYHQSPPPFSRSPSRQVAPSFPHSSPHP